LKYIFVQNFIKLNAVALELGYLADREIEKKTKKLSNDAENNTVVVTARTVWSRVFQSRVLAYRIKQQRSGKRRQNKKNS